MASLHLAECRQECPLVVAHQLTAVPSRSYTITAPIVFFPSGLDVVDVVVPHICGVVGETPAIPNRQQNLRMAISNQRPAALPTGVVGLDCKVAHDVSDG